MSVHALTQSMHSKKSDELDPALPNWGLGMRAGNIVLNCGGSQAQSVHSKKSDELDPALPNWGLGMRVGNIALTQSVHSKKSKSVIQSQIYNHNSEITKTVRALRFRR